MAARKTPNVRKSGTPSSPAQPKPGMRQAAGKNGITGSRPATKMAQARANGYGSVAAQQSVTRQFGLVKDAAGGWVKPDMAFLIRQAESWGAGPQAQAGALNEGSPYNIGGARWMLGRDGVNFTGERSDAAKQNPGQAYNSATQTPYGKPAGRGPKGKSEGRKGKGKGKGRGRGGGKGGGKDPGGMPGDPVFGGGPADNPGTANGATPDSFAKGVSGVTGEFITEKGKSQYASGEAEGGETKKGGKGGKGSKKAKKLTNKAKGKKSPGGSRVVRSERRQIRAAKSNPAPRKPSSRVTQRRKRK